MTPAIRAFLPPDLVLARFALATGIPLSELAGPSTTRDITWQRHTAMWAVRHLSSASLAQIGALLQRDAKSVENGINRVADRLGHEADYRDMMQALLDAITQPEVVQPAFEVGVSLPRLMAAGVLSDPAISDADAIQAVTTLLRAATLPTASVPAPPKGF